MSESKKIGIVLLATNAYFILGLRFIRRFIHHYKGNSEVKFYFYSDTDPRPFVTADIEFIETRHTSWVDGTNSKFINILNLEKADADYLFYFDADTNIKKDFTEEWFLGDLVGGQHFADQAWMKEVKNYDRNPKSTSYVPLDTPLPQMYYYGAFFGGTKANMMTFCQKLRENQLEDKKINYEPGVNDESYINQYFHYNPPTKVVPTGDFQFVISDKGGMGETRNTGLDIKAFKQEILARKNMLFDVAENRLKFYKT